MRLYGQHCALAKALDVVGDRWTMLIVRELSIRPCRYTDLRDGLPGIATNLLADRLRALEAAGVLTSEAAPPPVATTLYRLAPRGEELVPVLSALGRWGAPLLMAGREPTDEFRPRWMVPAIRAIFGEAEVRDLGPLEVVLDVAGEPLTVHVAGDRLDARLGAAPEPDLRVACGADTAFGLLVGGLDLDEAIASGAAEVTGHRAARSAFGRLIERAAGPPGA